jgi:hypothetical protein
MQNDEPATAGHGEQIVNNSSIGRDSVMREAPLRHDIKRFDKNKRGYTDVALAGDDEVPSDKGRPGGKHPSGIQGSDRHLRARVWH